MPVPIPCRDPGCTAPAVITDRWAFQSTHGPVEHVRTRCEGGHVFTPTLESLLAITTAAYGVQQRIRVA